MKPIALLVALLAALAVLLKTQEPEIRRYIKISSM